MGLLSSTHPIPSLAVSGLTVIFGIAFSFFKIQNAFTKGGIRSKEEDEIMGLDLPEMGVAAYPEFSLQR
jgi:ammonia channel protein AmtB